MMMLQKPLLLLAALTLCCCITSLHAFHRDGCKCIRRSPTPIPRRAIKRIEVIPGSGQCRWTEILITRRNGYTVCVNPKDQWVLDLLANLDRGNETSNRTSVSTNPSSKAHY